MIAHGSAFPVAKLALNNSVPPILMASLRMGLVFIILLPFWKFKIPEKKYFRSLIVFSISMGVMVYVFMNLSLYYSSIISPIILGSQLAIPFGILASALMLEDNFVGLFFASLMALFFGLAQVYSRQLKELNTSLINASTGLFGFIILLIISSLIEGGPIKNVRLINIDSWILIFYQAIVVSLCAHLLMFYLYKFYTVGKIFPFYSLFPIFGICLSYFVFGEIPSFLFLIGGIIVISSVILLHKID